MSLRKRQHDLAKAASILIDKAHKLGVDIMIVKDGQEKWAPYKCQEIPADLDLSIDIETFRFGTFIEEGDTYLPLGEWWESVGGIWGGRIGLFRHFAWPKTAIDIDKGNNDRRALEQCIVNLASGAGLTDVECGSYWGYTAQDLSRLMSAVRRKFEIQLPLGHEQELDSAESLKHYGCLDDLTEFLWGLEIRAS